MTIGEDAPSSSSPPGPRRTGAEVYERLKQDILTFNFRPGERLVELELCDRYEVSRTPVREALRRLEDEGLVIARDKGGRVVKGLDISDYEDVYAADQIDIEALENDWREGVPRGHDPPRRLVRRPRRTLPPGARSGDAERLPRRIPGARP